METRINESTDFLNDCHRVNLNQRGRDASVWLAFEERTPGTGRADDMARAGAKKKNPWNQQHTTVAYLAKPQWAPNRIEFSLDSSVAICSLTQSWQAEDVCNYPPIVG